MSMIGRESSGGARGVESRRWSVVGVLEFDRLWTWSTPIWFVCLAQDYLVSFASS